MDEIARHLGCLTALGKDPSTGDMTASVAFLPHLAERFPEETRLAYDIHVQSGSGSKNDLREFLDFNQVRVAAMRAAAAHSGGGRVVETVRRRIRSSRAALNIFRENTRAIAGLVQQVVAIEKNLN
ncbi:hypothetical protein T11_16691 [Trichinella zimbabwensis]|uniref:Uncharacterized protein n=1 Tax=Trichinella zimbabwensis TaxID=268475 RepID=A0A0V1GSD7_9BILA|nr:hypothetical protein T11_16691 [Trichinella zimbabwensis]